MRILVDRKWKKQGYTISNLYIDNVWFCNVIEDTDRGLEDSMTVDKIRGLKKAGITAIPKGTYKITLDIVSQKFGKQPFYKSVCNGKLPRLLGVKGFEGILIHAGNTAADSSGCLIVGENKVKGKVINSRAVFTRLYQKLLTSKNDITIKIQ